MIRFLAPVKTRLTLAFTCLMALVVATGSLLMYASFKRQLNLQIDERLVALASEYVMDFEEGDEDVLEELPNASQKSLFGFVFADNGTLLETNPGAAGLSLDLPDWPRVPAGVVIETTAIWPAASERGAVRVYAQEITQGRRVIIGRSVADRDRELAWLLWLLLVSGPALLVVTSVLAWFLSAASLRPVERLRQGAAKLSDTSPHLRLPTPDTGDEIALLAATLNSLLARLEDARKKERRILDDASHELRTPLAILSIETDLALRRARTTEELRASLVNAAKVSQDLNSLAEDLLVLSRANRGILEVHCERTDVADLVAQVATTFRTLAKRGDVRLEVGAMPGVVAKVDRPRLRQVLGNLLDNAIRHSPPQGLVTIGLARTDGSLSLSVSDEGPGFPPEFMDKAFDAFTRADAARTRQRGGAGLGLAIVKSVTEAHGGSVHLSNLTGTGASVTITLPA